MQQSPIKYWTYENKTEQYKKYCGAPVYFLFVTAERSVLEVCFFFISFGLVHECVFVQICISTVAGEFLLWRVLLIKLPSATFHPARVYKRYRCAFVSQENPVVPTHHKYRMLVNASMLNNSGTSKEESLRRKLTQQCCLYNNILQKSANDSHRELVIIPDSPYNRTTTYAAYYHPFLCFLLGGDLSPAVLLITAAKVEVRKSSIKTESVYRVEVRDGWPGSTSTEVLLRSPLSMSNCKPRSQQRAL